MKDIKEDEIEMISELERLEKGTIFEMARKHQRIISSSKNPSNYIFQESCCKELSKNTKIYLGQYSKSKKLVKKRNK